MYFRSIKKLSRETSLDEPIDQCGETGTLSLMDVLSCEDHSLERVENSDRCEMLFRCLHTALDARERDILTLRYGLSGELPLTQREVAARRGISRSYVSRRHYCKRCVESLENQAISHIIKEHILPFGMSLSTFFLSFAVIQLQ